MGRADVKKVRTRLRWFTVIVTVLTGINSFFNGSIAQSNGTNATGVGGAFLTAFFVLIVVLLFISIPFNVLAFFVVRSNRYPERAFRRISQVLTAFTVIISLLVAVYSYFGGFVAGSSTLKGAGSVIYSVIFTVIVMIIVVAIPVHVIAFLFFVIRGPRKEPDPHPAGWTKKEQKIYQQQRNRPTPPEVQALLQAQKGADWKKQLSDIAHKGNAILYASSYVMALTKAYNLSNNIAEEWTLKWSEFLSKASQGTEDIAVLFDRIFLNKQEEERLPEPLRLYLENVHRLLHEPPEQEES